MYNAYIVKAGGDYSLLLFRTFLFVIFMFGTKPADANGPKGSRGSQIYSTNDPRNPDCPCHKAQHLAEREYAGMKSPQRIQSSGKRNEHLMKIKGHPFRNPKSVFFRSQTSAGHLRQRGKWEKDPRGACPFWGV
jgi:hypothetical protein